MQRLFSLWLLIPLLLSCTTIGDRVRLSKFDQTAQAYETAVKRSQFGPAQQFVDPFFRKTKIDYDTYKNVKIVDFGVTHVTVSDDRLKVEQDVVLQYFLLDQNILKTSKYKQIWRYNETKGNWFLHTPLPSFDDCWHCFPAK